jgi:catechol 2,3-dioxygenase-like lactoylglutathione lyase family enzyme
MRIITAAGDNCDDPAQQRASRVRDNGSLNSSFYRKLGFELVYGGDRAGFSSMKAGEALVNLVVSPAYEHRWWGRAIFRVDDVDGLHRALQAQGFTAAVPTDATWGERFLHVSDPDGHELSFAELLSPGA